MDEMRLRALELAVQAREPDPIDAARRYITWLCGLEDRESHAGTPHSYAKTVVRSITRTLPQRAVRLAVTPCALFVSVHQSETNSTHHDQCCHSPRHVQPPRLCVQRAAYLYLVQSHRDSVAAVGGASLLLPSFADPMRDGHRCRC